MCVLIALFMFIVSLFAPIEGTPESVQVSQDVVAPLYVAPTAPRNISRVHVGEALNWQIARRVTWYNLWGQMTACGQILHRRTVGIAAKVGIGRCGDRIRLVKNGHVGTYTLIDRTGGVKFDLTRRACRQFLDGDCHSLRRVKWRIVP